MCLRVSRAFGPTMKIIYENMLDVLKFFTMWALLITMFSCVGFLIFSELTGYQNLFDVFVMFIESSIGSWNLSVYDKIDPDMVLKIHTKKGKIKLPGTGNVAVVGRLYHSIFLLLNQIILFNMLVGILGNTYAKYDEMNHGLYCDVLIKNFPFYRYDH